MRATCRSLVPSLDAPSRAACRRTSSSRATLGGVVDGVAEEDSVSDQSEQVRRTQSDDMRSAEELIAAYRRGPGLVASAIEGMDADALRARPLEGKMSSLEVLGHIADCEQFLADRMKRTIATNKPLLMGVDAGHYLDRLHYHERDPRLDLRLIEVTREQMAGDLARLTPNEWLREAVHSETGLVTLRQLLLHSIRHFESHVDAIHEKRAALGLDRG